MRLSKLAIPKSDLATFAKTRGMSRRLTANYLVHSILAEAFSECPSPFVVQDRGRVLRVLFYSEKDGEELVSQAKLAASPEAYEAIRWEEMASKPLPDPFPEGIELQFEVRACPVVRKASAGSGKNKHGEVREWDAGTELDAFLSAQWTSEEELSRDDVYCEWLDEQFENRGGAQIHEVSMSRFTLTEMTRRAHDEDRAVKAFDRPDVTLTGTLEVTEADGFAELLDSGIGRHKSFGYGMLRVRPA